jgi:hypothetical protein
LSCGEVHLLCRSLRPTEYSQLSVPSNNGQEDHESGKLESIQVQVINLFFPFSRLLPLLLKRCSQGGDAIRHVIGREPRPAASHFRGLGTFSGRLGVIAVAPTTFHLNTRPVQCFQFGYFILFSWSIKSHYTLHILHPFLKGLTVSHIFRFRVNQSQGGSDHHHECSFLLDSSICSRFAEFAY